MKKTLKPLWIKLKSNPHLFKLAAFFHNVYNNTNRKISGNGNVIKLDGAFLKNVCFDIVGDNNTVIINSRVKLFNTKIYIRGSEHRLLIGEDCYIKDGILWFEDYGCQIVIGSKTTVEQAGLAVTEPKSVIKIGEDCMLAYDVDIRSGDSHSIIDISSNERTNYAKDINIENHVWIAAHVQVLKGVSIGSNSIIGICSVVTKNIPANSLAVGVPAQVSKTGVTWLRKRIYKNTAQPSASQNGAAELLE